MTNTTRFQAFRPLAAPAASGRTARPLHKAAQDFEAMFLRQMLSSARTSTQGSEALFGHKPDDTFTQMRDDRFARSSRNRAPGLAARLEAQFASHLAAAAADTATRAVSGVGLGPGWCQGARRRRTVSFFPPGQGADRHGLRSSLDRPQRHPRRSHPA
jgi:flagellar protein FlgJ